MAGDSLKYDPKGSAEDLAVRHAADGSSELERDHTTDLDDLVHERFDAVASSDASRAEAKASFASDAGPIRSLSEEHGTASRVPEAFRIRHAKNAGEGGLSLEKSADYTGGTALRAASGGEAVLSDGSLVHDSIQSVDRLRSEVEGGSAFRALSEFGDGLKEELPDGVPREKAGTHHARTAVLGALEVIDSQEDEGADFASDTEATAARSLRRTYEASIIPSTIIEKANRDSADSLDKLDAKALRANARSDKALEQARRIGDRIDRIAEMENPGRFAKSAKKFLQRRQQAKYRKARRENKRVDLFMGRGSGFRGMLFTLKRDVDSGLYKLSGSLLGALRKILVIGMAGVLAVILPLHLATSLFSGLLASSSSSTPVISGIASAGGDMLVSVAMAEYESGKASGTYHEGDSARYAGRVGNWPGEWCGAFVSWCADQCGFVDSGDMTASGGSWVHINYFRNNPDKGEVHLYSTSPSYDGYLPVAGDLFVRRYVGDYGDHIGIVTGNDGDKTFYTVEGNTGGPNGVYYGDHGGAGFVNIRTHSLVDGIDYSFAHPYYPSVASRAGSIAIPETNNGLRIGRVFTYTCLGPDGWHMGYSLSGTAVGLPDRYVWEKWVRAGAPYSDHICILNGRYLIACMAMFGEVGDKITFYLDDGTAIPCVMVDNKGTDALNPYGHVHGQDVDVIEFEVETDFARVYRNNPGTSGWMPQWMGRRVVSASNEGSIL